MTTPKSTPRVYVGGPRNTEADLLPGSVWKGVNGTIKDRQATVDVGPHLGEKGVMRVTVTGHMPGGGIVKKTSPALESFLADYRLLTPAPAMAAIETKPAVASTLAGARHYMPLEGENGYNTNRTACGARLNDVYFTSERAFVVNCGVCCAAAKASLDAETTKAAQAKATPSILVQFEVAEPGYIIRDPADRVVRIDTGSTPPLVLREILSAAILPKPVMNGSVTIGKIRVLRFVPAEPGVPAHLIAFVKLVDSWSGKSLLATPARLHETAGNVTHLEIGSMSATSSRPALSAPIVAPAAPTIAPVASPTIAAPPMDQGRAFGPPTMVKPEEVANLQGIGIIHQPFDPGNPTPGRLNVELLVSKDTAEMIEANRKKDEADKVAPMCLCSDSEALALGRLPSMRSLGAGLGHCTANGMPIDARKYHEWVKSLLTDQATLDSFRKENAAISPGSTAPSAKVNASANASFAAEQLIKLLGLDPEDLRILTRLIELKSIDLSNPDADLNVQLSLSQYMRLLIRTEGRKAAAKIGIGTAFRHMLQSASAPH